MKNSKYFPFERNRYFYGKMLSVNDFELEQNYNINKRNVINRFLHGAGIVNGLSVVAIDDDSISVESGLALDYQGREIVVDIPSVYKLSSLDGYDHCVKEAGFNYMYLCLAYDEKETNRVLSVTNSVSFGQVGDEEQYNRITESYNLYLTNMEPDENRLTLNGYFWDKKILFMENDIIVKAEIQKYVLSGDDISLKIYIENTGRLDCAIEFKIILENATYMNSDRIDFSFYEHMHEKKDIYVVEYKLKSSDIKEGIAAAVFDTKNIVLKINDSSEEIVCDDFELHTNIVKDSISYGIIEEYTEKEIELINKEMNDSKIYLAKIYFDRLSDGCSISNIKNVPFEQYVFNSRMALMLHKAIQHNNTGEKLDNSGSDTTNVANQSGSNVDIKQGVVKLSTATKDPRNDVVYSKDINHCLGLGNVSIILGIEQSDSSYIYGAPGLFEGDKEKILLSAKVNPKTGTFMIAAKVPGNSSDRTISIHWTAIQDKSSQMNDFGSKRIIIKPSMLELRVRESYNLESECEKMVDKAINWVVKDNGGSINQDGLYTAPNVPGVYEIIAQSVAYPDVKSSIYVLVRE